MERCASGAVSTACVRVVEVSGEGGGEGTVVRGEWRRITA